VNVISTAGLFALSLATCAVAILAGERRLLVQVDLGLGSGNDDFRQSVGCLVFRAAHFEGGRLAVGLGL